MTNNNKLTPTSTNNLSSLAKAKKPGLSPLYARKAAMDSAKAAASAQAVEMPNRIALLLDVSGSMAGRKIDDLRKAYDSFVAALDLSNTALAIAHFGYENDAACDVSLTTDRSLIMITGVSLHANGSTPMAEAMERVISTQPLTRAVLISDGEPNDEHRAYTQAKTFREAGVPCDCVHIGSSSSGEDVLKKIAEITGGIYLKFTDTGNFAKSFSYLTPAGRALMLSGNVSASDLGATEIRFLK